MPKLLIHIENENEKLSEYLKNNSINTSKIAKTKSIYAYGSKDSLTKLNDFISTIGLNTITDEKAKLKSYISSHAKHHQTSQVHNTAYFFPNQLAQIYNMVPKNQSKRVLIGIIELGGGFTSTDLQKYWTLVGLTNTKPIVNSVSIDGGINNPRDVSSSTEVLLDIEVVGSICPNSVINVYFAPNTYQGFYDAIAHAISDNCSSISISWGGPEIDWNVQYMNVYNNLFAIAVRKGITICVSSGDGNSLDGTNTNTVDFPGSSPNVLCCGGTKLICPNLIYDNRTIETIWNDRVIEGSGGGYSSVFRAPSYQTNNITNFNNFRGVPDVCADASPQTGIIILQNGTQYVVGGTSAVSPLWAGYLASIGCKKFVNNVIYPLKGVGFRDIKIGDNVGYNAATGWDPCSGWGSCNGSILSKYL